MPPIVSSVVRSLGTGSQSSESLLQHAYFIVAVVLVVLVILTRLIVLRQRNQALSNFFRLRATSQYRTDPTSHSNHDSIYRGVHLTPLPAAYHSDRRVHAADVDAHGRRLGPSGQDWEGKDVLPAYDSSDRPPKYIDLGWSHGGPAPPHVDPQSAITLPSPIREQANGDYDEPDVHTSAATAEVALPTPIHHS